MCGAERRKRRHGEGKRVAQSESGEKEAGEKRNAKK